MRVETFKQMVAPLEQPFADVEKVIIAAVERGTLRVRIDHQQQAFIFLEAATARERASNQLTALGRGLFRVLSRLPTDAKAAEALESAKVAKAQRFAPSRPVFEAPLLYPRARPPARPSATAPERKSLRGIALGFATRRRLQ